jgi:hypothetical protein
MCHVAAGLPQRCARFVKLRFARLKKTRQRFQGRLAG